MFDGIVICVNYDDLLQLTLPSNMKHLSKCLVVTSTDDDKTYEFAKTIPNVSVLRTNAFTRYGAKFNKGLAMEEGFRILNSKNWVLIWDADTLFPDHMPTGRLDSNCLYGPPRLILSDPKTFNPANPADAWLRAERTHDKEFPGYFQLFNMTCPYLWNKPFWYDPTFTHAGGGDAYFQSLWPSRYKRRLRFNVLHLGPRDKNWYGRVTDRLDDSANTDVEEKTNLLSTLQIQNGWKKGSIQQPVIDRVHVPGYESHYVWNTSQPPRANQ